MYLTAVNVLLLSVSGVERLLARVERFDRAQNVYLDGQWGTLRRALQPSTLSCLVLLPAACG